AAPPPRLPSFPTRRSSDLNDAVLFSVEPVTGAQYIARAFFPSTEDSTRNVLVNTDQIFTSGWAPDDVLAHELGHSLGFRHEHTRSEEHTSELQSRFDLVCR